MQKMFLPLLHFLCLLCHALAWESFPRKCENYSLATQENFNVTQFLGTWLEVEDQTKCTTVNLTRVSEFELDLQRPNTSENGAISFREPSYLNWMNASVLVVGTDYKDYAVLWLCKNANESETQSQQQLWIWRRNHTLPESAVAAINSTIAGNNLTHFPIGGKLEGCGEFSVQGGNVTITVTNGTVIAGTLTPPNATANGTIHDDHTTHNATIQTNSGLNLHTRGLSCGYAAVLAIITTLIPAAYSQA